MQIIIVGAGKVGSTLVEQLVQEGDNVTVIDNRSEKIREITESYDVMGIVGNGASYSIQMEAGVESAELLIAVTGSDELNLLCCLIAKKAGNCQTIARVRNPVYNKEIGFIKEELGLSMIINPEFAAAMEIARILRFPSAIKIDTFAKGRVELLKFKIRPGLRLHNYLVSDIHNKLHSDVLVCAVERGDEVFIPGGDFMLKEQDTVSIIAPPKVSSDFFRKIGVETHQVKDAMIAGGGTIAYYLAMQLIYMGIDVRIIEKDKVRCEELSELLPKAIVIQGDATDQDLLLEEGLKRAEAFVAMTNFDEENLLLALFAKSVSNAKLVAKVNRINFKDVINQLDIDSIIYPKYITSNSILRYVRAMENSIGSNVETLYKILDNRAEALEFRVQEESPVTGITLEELNLKTNLLVCSISRAGKIFIPGGRDTIQVGDSVIVVTTNAGLHDIRDILRS